MFLGNVAVVVVKPCIKALTLLTPTSVNTKCFKYIQKTAAISSFQPTGVQKILPDTDFLQLFENTLIIGILLNNLRVS